MSKVFGPEPARTKFTCGYAGPDHARGAGSCGKWVQAGEPAVSILGDDNTRVRYCEPCARPWIPAPAPPPPPREPAASGPPPIPPRTGTPSAAPAGAPYAVGLTCPKCDHSITIKVA